MDNIIKYGLLDMVLTVTMNEGALSTAYFERFVDMSMGLHRSGSPSIKREFVFEGITQHHLLHWFLSLLKTSSITRLSYHSKPFPISPKHCDPCTVQLTSETHRNVSSSKSKYSVTQTSSSNQIQNNDIINWRRQRMTKSAKFSIAHLQRSFEQPVCNPKHSRNKDTNKNSRFGALCRRRANVMTPVHILDQIGFRPRHSSLISILSFATVRKRPTIGVARRNYITYRSTFQLLADRWWAFQLYVPRIGPF